MELKVLLEKENNWAIAIQYLQEWGALILIDKKIQNDKYWKRRISWALRLGLNPLTAFISNSINPVKLAERLDLSHSQQKLLSESTQINKHFLSLYVSKKTENWDAQRWCEEIESANWDPTAIAIAICLGNPLWRPLLRWWGRWRLIKAETTAEELIKKGWEQGPALGQELKRLRKVELKKYKRTKPS
jgi:poly(A) polymerase